MIPLIEGVRVDCRAHQQGSRLVRRPRAVVGQHHIGVGRIGHPRRSVPVLQRATIVFSPVRQHCPVAVLDCRRAIGEGQLYLLSLPATYREHRVWATFVHTDITNRQRPVIILDCRGIRRAISIGDGPLAIIQNGRHRTDTLATGAADGGDQFKRLCAFILRITLTAQWHPDIDRPGGTIGARQGRTRPCHTVPAVDSPVRPVGRILHDRQGCQVRIAVGGDCRGPQVERDCLPAGSRHREESVGTGFIHRGDVGYAQVQHADAGNGNIAVGRPVIDRDFHPAICQGGACSAVRIAHL